jgi:hypothetical protein
MNYLIVEVTVEDPKVLEKPGLQKRRQQELKDQSR